MDVEEIYLKAVKVLGSKEAARHWLCESARALDYQAPCEVMQAETGRQNVITLLEQLEYCVYI